METDFLGATFDLSLLRKLPEVVEISVITHSGEKMSLADMTFHGWLVDHVGKRMPLDIDLARKDVLAVSFPGLPCGAYKYEIWLKSDAGVRRLASGRVGVLDVVAELEEVQAAGERRHYGLHMPDISGRRLRAEAVSSSAAQAAARLANEQADRAEKARDEAKEAAKEAAEEAAKLIDIDEYVEQVKQEAAASMDEVIERKAEDFEQRVKDVVTESMADLDAKREELKAALAEIDSLRQHVAELQQSIRDSIVIDEDGFLWIGGEPTGHKMTGEPGKSPYVDEEGLVHWYDDASGEWHKQLIKAKDGFTPYVNERGFWVGWDDLTQQEIETPYRAYGVDGIDGDSVQRHLVGSVAEIPLSGDTCSGGHYYYVPKGKSVPQVDIVLTGDTRTFTQASGIVDALTITTEGGLSQRVAISGKDLQGAVAAVAAAFPGGEVWAAGKQVDGRDRLTLYTKDKAFSVALVEGSYWMTGQVEIEETPADLNREGWAVYAWLLDAQGGGAWHEVAEKNDISTKVIYGLNKLGTDLVIVNGVPVGTNQDGELNIPTASMRLAGGVKVSSEETIGDGSIIGLNAAGQLVGAKASLFETGGVRISIGEICGASVVGYTIDGSLGIMFGDVGQPGVFAVTERAKTGAARISCDEAHNLTLNIADGEPICYYPDMGLGLKLGSGLGLDSNGLLFVPQGSASVFGLVKLDDTFSIETAAATVSSIKAQLKEYAKTADALTIETFDEKLKEALQGEEYHFATADDIKDFISKEEADKLYQAKGGTLVRVYERYADMPALEDQQPDTLYLSPAP